MTAKKDKKARRLARKRKVQRHTSFSGQQVLLNRVRASQHFQGSDLSRDTLLPQVLAAMA
jgi:hypothetical protein